MKMTNMTMATRRRRNSGGFTLIEMVLVLAIIALLVGGAIGLLSGVRDEGRRIRVQGDFKAIDSALTIYESRCLRLPTTAQGLQALVTKPTQAPVPRNWGNQMKKLPLDPWGNEYVYRYPGSRNTDGYDLIAPGPDHMIDTADDVGNWDVD